MLDVELIASASDGDVVVALRGDLDIASQVSAEAAITALVAGGQHVVIDMSALDFIDCGSVRALLRVRALARRGGGDVVLAAPRPIVRRLLALPGTDKTFRVKASVSADVAGVAGQPGR
jgi:anti-sigma B factor antagonist